MDELARRNSLRKIREMLIDLLLIAFLLFLLQTKEGRLFNFHFPESFITQKLREKLFLINNNQQQQEKKQLNETKAQYLWNFHP